ncbi:MAG: hypothetical protein KAS12_04790 [Candidatus Aenigmarchaeota archaeon]|nr:hypothetical protein [Candidatus Aenigmarchaeota archaeon]
MTLIDKLDIENQKKLNEIIANITKYTHIYKSEKNSQIAQMWLIILELYKKQELMQQKIKKLEEIINKEEIHSTKKQNSELLKNLENY